MWRNPITDKQIRVLTDEWGVKEEEHVAGRVRSITGWFQVVMVSIPWAGQGQTRLLTSSHSPLASMYFR
jgi:hypothetical protein